MAQIHKLHVATDIKSPADKFYGRFKNNMSELTKVYPEIYKSIEVHAGDGKSAGSVILWKYAIGNGEVSVGKEKIVAVDNKNRSITFEVIQGDLLDVFKTFLLKIQVAEKANKNVVNWTLEFEKTSEDVADPYMLLGLLDKVTKKLDAYILKET